MKLNIIKRVGIIFLLPASLVLTACDGSDIVVDPPASSSSSSQTTASSTSSAESSSSSSSASSVMSVPPPPELELVYAINVGATEEATMNEVDYQPDRFFTEGTVNATTDPISGVADYEVYQTERYGLDFSYSIPVTSATYTVILHFTELYQTTTGARTFSVSVEGNTELTDMDLFSLVGHDGAFEYVYEDLPINDGQLTISFSATDDNATLSGIAIYSDDGGRLSQ